MLSGDARNEWLTILAVGALLSLSALLLWWPLVFLPLGLTLFGVAFFRDPHRRPPTQRGAVVAPCDGKVSSIHPIEHFEPLGEAATCIRIFMSVFDVHVNRCPCHGKVAALAHKPGEHRNALNPDSAEANESNLIVLRHPMRDEPVAAVRQIAGAFARTIHCGVREEQILQRGQRIGIIKLGSTTELYLPAHLEPAVQIQVGQKVKGGLTVVARVKSTRDQAEPAPAESASAATNV
jgi:phosphatidylserine decarboxylase